MLLMISDSEKKPLACWKSRDRYRNKVLDTLTIILRTGGCAWNRCLMCGYRYERSTGLNREEQERSLAWQLSWVKNAFSPDGYQVVKIFTSGSFFDPGEVPPNVRILAAELFRGKLVIAETRPEFVEEEAIGSFSAAIDDGSWDIPLYVAMGLETVSDPVREKSICKGFTFEDFCHASRVSRKAGAGVKAYLLMKPLFLTEREALEDMHVSVKEVSRRADLVSMNPCTVQSRTDLEWYWRRGAYRPPYLWSVLEVLDRAPVHITCDPLGGGQVRGPHNCGRCDHDIIQAVRDYSLSGDRAIIGKALATDCACKNEWEFVLREERPFCMPLTR
jgi:radical SAM enzyme (TIGR01210 family)